MINKLRIFSGLSGRLAGAMLYMVLALAPAWAGNPTFEQGREAYVRGDTTKAVELWSTLAKQGDKEAQFAMGTLFYAGVGVAVDHTESSYWFQRAAEQGYAAAQYNLGNAYKRGEGVRQNDAMAVRWWQKAAAQGFAAAQFNLALAYYDGAGIEQNGARAMSLIRQAAENGHQPAADLLVQLSGEVKPAPAAGAASDSEPEQTECQEWLQRQTDASYTIQLVSTSKKEGAERLASEHKLKGYAICSYTSGGKTLHSLLLGVYPEVEQAKQVVDALAPEVRAIKPWIRTIGSVKRTVTQKQP